MGNKADTQQGIPKQASTKATPYVQAVSANSTGLIYLERVRREKAKRAERVREEREAFRKFTTPRSR